MAVTATPIFPQTIKNYAVQILPADTTATKTIATGGTNGTKIESLIVTSTDTTARDVAITITISAVVYVIGTVSIPITAGNTNAAPSIDIFRSAQIPGLAYDSNGNKYLYLASAAILGINCLTTVTAAKAIQIFGQGGDF